MTKDENYGVKAMNKFGDVIILLEKKDEGYLVCDEDNFKKVESGEIEDLGKTFFPLPMKKIFKFDWDLSDTLKYYYTRARRLQKLHKQLTERIEKEEKKLVGLRKNENK